MQPGLCSLHTAICTIRLGEGCLQRILLTVHRSPCATPQGAGWNTTPACCTTPAMHFQLAATCSRHMAVRLGHVRRYGVPEGEHPGKKVLLTILDDCPLVTLLLGRNVPSE